MAERAPEACMPCRGTGSVVSNLGGEGRQVSCPWCGGGGVRRLSADAQGAWLERQAAGGDGGESPADAVA